MNFWQQISSTFDREPGTALAILAAAAAVMGLLVLYLLGSVVMLRRRYSFLLRHEDTQDLGVVFAGLQRQVETMQEDLRQLREEAEALRRQAERCIQKVGLVRFDAFEDVGGEQSYALALLDAKDNGVVLTSLYSRSDSRTYAKGLRSGRSGYNLSDEELRAIREAGSQAEPRAAAGEETAI